MLLSNMVSIQLLLGGMDKVDNDGDRVSHNIKVRLVFLFQLFININTNRSSM